MNNNLYYDDFEVGKEFTTRETTLSQKQVDQFAELTGDLNPLHINEEFAGKTIFGKRIAHGMLVMSLALGLWDGEDITRSSIIALVGLNNVSIKAPTFPNNKLHLVSRVLKKRLSSSRPGAGIVTFRDQMQNEKGDVVMEAERTLLLKMKTKEWK